MLIPSLTTLRVEDFPSEREWIGKLLFPLNQFLLAATTSINGNITFTDNIPCQTQVLSFTYGGSGTLPITFKWNLIPKPVEVRVCSATEDSSPIGLVVAWSFSNSVISISNFYKLTNTGATSLTTGSVYNIVLRAQP